MKFTFPPESKPLSGFTIKRAIHRGGFGEVYYGLTDAGKEVALKLLHQHTDVELRGATACLNLNHPNLVTIYDIKSDADGDHWVVMEYVGGKRLCDVMEDRGRLPVEEIERWMDGMAAGLTFLHDRGIVHRDLKPSNVFSENGVVKVGDVGLSKFISESRRSAHTQSVGTVYYMAPEVARGRYGREVDVYALGIILYEMLTGEVPFDGESTGEILMKHLSQPPDLEKIPARLRSVLSRALEKDPHRRTASVNRLRDEFKAAVRGRALGDDAAQDIPDHAFLDSQERLRHEARTYATAAQAEAQNDARSAQQRAAEYARRSQDQARWQAERMRSRRHGCGGRVANAFTDANRHWPQSRPGEKNWLPFAVVGGVLAFVFFTGAGRAMGPTLWEGAILAAIAYGIYSFVKWMTPAAAPIRVPVHQPAATGPTPSFVQASPSVPVAARVAPAPPPRKPPLPSPDTPRTIAFSQRANQLSGSMTVAALATAVITAALAALGFVRDVPSALLFGSTATIGSWTVLGATKLIEGTSLYRFTRRLWQGAAGLVVGLGAYGLDQFLLVDFTPEGQGGRYYGLITSVGDMSFAEQGEPAAVAYMAFFGLLFLLRRWWWQSDAYRPKRLKISSALMTALLGYVLTTLIYFPHAWGIVWAVVISCVVQLAAAWTPPEDRGATTKEAAPAA